MDFSIGPEDVAAGILQELWNDVGCQVSKLVSETKDVVVEKKSFQEFSRSISELNVLLSTIDTRKVEAARGSQPTKATLEALITHLKRACHIIQHHKSRSRLQLLLNSHKMLLQMQDVAKDIAHDISFLQLVNLDIALNSKTKMEQIINNLSRMELRSASATDFIASEITNSISQNSHNRENAQKLLEKIAEATGAKMSVSMVREELALLKQEKEELELQKKQADALHISQLMQLLYSTEIIAREHDTETSTNHHQYHPFDSFLCPLCNTIMTDPVAISCGHSFERTAIQELLRQGGKHCPKCKQEITSSDLTPNLTLRSTIEEWNKKDMELKFQAAVRGIKSNDHDRKKEALEDLQYLMENPQYAVRVAEEGLTLTFIAILKDNGLDYKAALKCLYYLAKFNDGQKDAIIEAGAVRRIVKLIYKGGEESDAISVLLELSKKEILREKIGNAKDCIQLLVSLLQKNNPDVSEKAQHVLQNLSSNTHFVVKMAEAGHFQPFVSRFNQGPQETRALMAAALIKMQLKENSIKDLKDRQFIHNLIQMLSSSFPASKSACLKSIKKLLAYPRMVKRLLEVCDTIPHMLSVISYVGSDPYLKQETAETLALLIGASKHLEFQKYQGLQELQSEHNVSLLLQYVANDDDETKIQFMHLLVELSCRSETARDIIRNDNDAITHLFSSLRSDKPSVRRWAMKLIYCISEGHPGGVPVPHSSAKETAINTLAEILTSSPDIEERSIAAGIISQLPSDDAIIDEILHKSEALKAIHEVICSMDEENSGNMVPVSTGSSLLENALAALLRYTEPTKPELQRQLSKLELYPSLVRVLSRGTSLAKQRTAILLAQLSRSNSHFVSDSSTMAKQAKYSLSFHLMKWCWSASSEDRGSCPVHGDACSPRDTFCLVKADAVKPLVRSLSETESGVAEAAIMALETLLTDHSTLSNAAAAIVESQGLVAILQVLEKGTLSAKTKALDLFQKILTHSKISDPIFNRSERILIQLLQDDELRKKAALVLRQMNVIPDQSSYF
ncbi:hypothetical protein FEM48_Zijuj10G0176200 [Ziziphus jujuba var. spinosa]|uniref:RING-type E3 ubiquitin transferase n=1 Tax=Ziziphus jujuba var. spinosa TaxID=714518 RepID=A0A978UPS5_ZIZJJ|nr:hypothetical protein FEM48_Zijuj10G0176200 [Ziziphus jujuba var. spinosa]